MFIEIWRKIAESNAFNFIVMLGIFAYIFKKIDIKQAAENLINNVASTLKKAEEENRNAKLNLENAKDEVKDLDNELYQAVQLAQSRAEELAKQLEETTEAKVSSIKSNTLKMIEGEEKTISSTLSKKCAELSVQKAEEKIVELLKTQPELHEKYILNSIEELDRISL